MEKEVQYLEIPPKNDNVMDQIIPVLFSFGLSLLKLDRNIFFLNCCAMNKLTWQFITVINFRLMLRDNILIEDK